MNRFSNSSLRWLETILSERFGLAFSLREEETTLLLTVPGSHQSICFDRLQDVFHECRSDFGCEDWKPSMEGFIAPLEDTLPAPSTIELPHPLIELIGNTTTIHYDILGLTYWALARLEEVGRKDLDEHHRFPATSSHAYLNDYLERPIIDEWLYILRQIIQRVWPQIELKEHYFEIKVSHDVDGPARYAFQSLGGLLRTMAGDVIRRKDFRSALLGPWIWMNSKDEIHSSDPANTFDWLMDQSEENGLTSAFYFICGRTDPIKDAKYDPEMPQIRRLMRKIHSRGHEIGIHPSYDTYNKPDEIRREADRLRKVCDEEGITQTEWGGRMHFLRWDQSVTLRAWSDAGMAYDTTLSYADRPGFRCGTCFEYPAFDVVTEQALHLRIRPLIAMDCTVIADRYLGLGSTEAAFQKFNELKNRCKAVGGVFTLLWHNSFFNTAEDFHIYSRLLNDKMQ
jgi:hypothetical protein